MTGSVSDYLGRVRIVKLSDLKPYARNARTHSPEQVEQIALSIKEYGWTNPILVDKNNEIIAGHGRYAAAERLGISEVPVVVLDDLTEEQKRAYVLADNKIALNAGWDEDLLKAELSELRDAGFDLELTGFSWEEINDLLLDEIETEKDPEECPETPEEPYSQEGDMWVLGPHRVLCGDSTSAPAWSKLMDGELADVIWTDPPYNVAYESDLAGSIKNDDMDDGAFRAFLLACFRVLFEISKPGAPIYVAHADTEGLNFRAAFREAGFKLANCLIWKKNALVLGRSDYQWIHEPILYGWKPGSKHRWYGGRKQVTFQDLGDVAVMTDDGRLAVQVGDRLLVLKEDAIAEERQSTVIYHDKPKRSAAHPTMKPVSLVERLLKNSARPNDIVVDAFGGSGSTL
ncbi:site-specific DNA-methyltransferase, partial [Candidatus Parcubacteria bacterium]